MPKLPPDKSAARSTITRGDAPEIFGSSSSDAWVDSPNVSHYWQPIVSRGLNQPLTLRYVGASSCNAVAIEMNNCSNNSDRPRSIRDALLSGRVGELDFVQHQPVDAIVLAALDLANGCEFKQIGDVLALSFLRKDHICIRDRIGDDGHESQSGLRLSVIQPSHSPRRRQTNIAIALYAG